MVHPTLMPGIGKYGGCAYAVVTGMPITAGFVSLFVNASPAVANGNIAAATVTSPDGFVVGLSKEGCPIINTIFGTNRESFYLDVYNTQLRSWYGQTIEWVNNHLPAYDGSLNTVNQVVQGQLIQPVGVENAMTDADGDVMTYAIVAGSLPPGLSMDSSGNITGTPI